MGAASEESDGLPDNRPASELAAALMASERDVRQVAGALAGDGQEALLAAAALQAVAEQDPKLLGPIISKVAKQIRHSEPDVSAACGAILTELCKTAPAKVAKQIEPLKAAFQGAAPVARNGIVHTFIGLCAASVVYQRRLGDTLTDALCDADLSQLEHWARLMLPTLKGEPYANAREIVERRLADLPRDEGQALCASLGVSYRGRPTG